MKINPLTFPHTRQDEWQFDVIKTRQLVYAIEGFVLDNGKESKTLNCAIDTAKYKTRYYFENHRSSLDISILTILTKLSIDC